MNARRILKLATRFEEFVEIPTSINVLKQGNGSIFGHDDVRLTTHNPQPLAELFCIGNGRGKGYQRDALREVENDLLPHRSAKLVGKIVNLVHDDKAEVRQEVALCVEHVAQHFGCHDHNAGGRVDARITRQQPNLIGPVHRDQILKLLI